MATAIQPTSRRWSRFSIKTMLIVTSLLAIILGWGINPILRQRRAVAALNRLDALATSESRARWHATGKGPAHEPFSVSVFYGPPAIEFSFAKYIDQWFGRDWRHSVTSVQFYGATDREIAILDGLPRLKGVVVQGDSRITNDGIGRLVDAHPKLEGVDLRVCGCDITDAGLGHLLRLKRLHHLYVTGASSTREIFELLKSQGVTVAGATFGTFRPSAKGELSAASNNR